MSTAGRSLRALVLALTWAVASCSEAPKEAGSRRLIAHEVFRSGAVDDPQYAFTAIGSMALVGDSLALGLHHQEQVIRVFDGEGRIRRMMGGPGGGPGEFISPQSIGVVGDRLWVQDYGTGSIHILDLAGEELARVRFEPIPVLDGQVMARATSALASGKYLAEVQSWGSRWFRSTGPISFPILVLDSLGAVSDTIAYQHWTSKRGFLQQETTYLGIGLKDHPRVDASPKGDAIMILDRTVDPSRPGHRVTLVRITGDTVYSRFVDADPIPVSGALRDSLVKEFSGDRPQFRRTIEKGVDAFPHLPTAGSILLDNDQRAWVELAGVSDVAVWSVLDSVGSQTFEVALPREARLLASTGDLVWVQERDEFDVPYLVKYRLLQPS